jgi:hypothetical protein
MKMGWGSRIQDLEKLVSGLDPGVCKKALWIQDPQHCRRLAQGREYYFQRDNTVFINDTCTVNLK